MVGQWAFAMHDRRDGRLWLVRDRFGEKPLFYHQNPAAFAFASSIPALLKAPWVPRALDREAMVEYVTMRYVVSPRTVIRGIRKVPAGHVLRVDADGAALERWYTPRFHRPQPRTRAAAADEFGELLTTAARRCMVSDVPVALSLSDGIDSNAIRAALRDTGGIRSFTYALADSASGFSPSAAPAPGGSETLDLRVTPDDRLEAMLPAFASFAEPVGDGAALATWLLIRKAREQATVFLCGHGGDEVLGDMA